MKIQARYSGSTTAKIVDVVVQLNGQCLYTYGFMVAESTYSTRCFSGGFKGMDINVRYIPSDPRLSFATAAVITWPIYLIGTVIVVISSSCACAYGFAKLFRSAPLYDVKSNSIRRRSSVEYKDCLKHIGVPFLVITMVSISAAMVVFIVLGVLMVVPAQGRPRLEDAPRHNSNGPEYDPEDPFAVEDEYDPEDPFAGEDNRAAVAELYNNATATDENARRNGPMISMKRFHNEIKDFLLGRFAYNKDALLDLCCGRGGDIHKWIKNKVKFVKALDLSDVSLADAKTRYAEVARTKKIKTKVEFVHTSSLGTSKWKDDKEYDVITCMFAMHYISDREDTMRTFLHNVAINLKPGGIFMGTIASGTRVMHMLGVEEGLHTGVLKLYKMWSKDQEVAVTTSPFGMRYVCSITDTVTSGNSPEYLTFIKPVEDILAEYGIFPVTHYGCQELDHCFDIEDDDKTLKHFCPPANFPKEIREVSSMFGAFVFRKKP